ncbi:MAG: nuclear transport factor 2 family protein [bacterium]|nr:nuclear transport factor 2 family protein [bacterium]
MKKRSMILSAGVIFCISVFLVSSGFLSYSAEEDAVKKVITNSYFNGAFNDQNTEEMAKGFHPDFAIYSANGEEISKYPIKTWIDNIESRKKRKDFEPDGAKMDCRVLEVDVTGGAANVKVDMHKNGTKIYTDYLLLLKFDSGWRIVGKVYHQHSNR